MKSRKPVTSQTIRGMAAQLAGAPVTPVRAKDHAAAFEPLMAAIAGLRSLPLKDSEPAVVFAPEDDRP